VIAGDNLTAFSPKDAVNNNGGRPVYIVHGTDDARIAVHHTRQLAEIAVRERANVTVWIPEAWVMWKLNLPSQTNTNDGS